MTDQPYSWDESKRRANLEKHGLDFADAMLVLESRYRLDVASVRNDELRTQSFAFVFDFLAVLTVIHLDDERVQIISFRHASASEREAYHAWLEKDYDGA